MPVIDLTSACVAQYKMNDNLGDKVVLDSVGGGDGTAINNTADMHVTGKIGGAFLFDGVSDGVNTGRKFSTLWQSPFTLCFWMKLPGGLFDSTSSQPFAIYSNVSGDESSAFYAEGYTPGNLALNFSSPSGNGATTTYVNSVAGDFTTIGDGVEAWKFLTIIAPIGLVDFEEPFSSFFLGIANIGGASNLHGSLDNVMLFNRALTQDEIDFLYNSGNGTELIQRDLDMAFTLNYPTPSRARSGQVGLLVNATIADCQGNEELIAAPGAGKRIAIKRFTISSATATNFTFNAATTALLGPYLSTTGGGLLQIEFADDAMPALPLNTALNVDAANSGVVTITAEYDIQGI